MKRTVENIEEHEVGKRLILDCLHTLEPQSLIEVEGEINCLQCDQLRFPENLNAYKRTSVFNHETIPKGFRRAHSTKKGVWALITVLNGRVRYVVDYLDNLSIDIDEYTKGVIAPQMEHHLEVIGDVELYVEFYTKAISE